MRHRLVPALVSIVVVLLVTAAASFADPNLTNIPRHRHYVMTASGLSQVGPRVCDNPDLQAAFNQFHNNLHIATPTSIGPAAPGLHNFKGAELMAGPC